MHDVADRETVGVAEGVAKRVTRSLQRFPRRIRIEPAWRQCRFSCGDAPSAIENTIHVDRPDNRRCILLTP